MTTWMKIWNWMCEQDWLILVIPMALMTILFYAAGLVWWGGMFTVIMAIFGFTEVWSYMHTGHTISQQFAKFLKEHKVFAWAIIWTMMIFWFGVIVHLATTGTGD